MIAFILLGIIRPLSKECCGGGDPLRCLEEVAADEEEDDAAVEDKEVSFGSNKSEKSNLD
jgi:hypothetical protein